MTNIYAGARNGWEADYKWSRTKNKEFILLERGEEKDDDDDDNNLLVFKITTIDIIRW